MPTKREREYYRMGFIDGQKWAGAGQPSQPYIEREPSFPEPTQIQRRVTESIGIPVRYPKKRKLSAWNKFVKANSKKPRFVLRSGKLNLKKMGVAFRKTPQGKKKRR